ncbi:MAG: cation transporter [Marinibacterium sp.]|nr:cation transporter [Marinibacterium sp.]
MQQSLAIEQNSLIMAKWANLMMAIAGLTAGFLANADALLLDGLFSGLNFLSAIAAARVAVSVRRRPDASRPFGYEVDESMFVMFRSLLLIGVVSMAFVSAVSRVIVYLHTGEATPVSLGWISGYVGLMMVVCFALYLYHRHNWRLTGRKSAILRAEARAALVDGVMSAGAGAAFLLIAMLQGGPLDAIVPVSDAIIVIVLCLAMIPQPVRMFRAALQDVVGVAVPAQELACIRAKTRALMAQSRFEVLDVAVVRTGRMLFHMVYLRPKGEVGVNEVEAARTLLAGALAPERVEIMLAAKPPFDVI